MVADIEAMHHQVKDHPEDHKYLQFLWCPGENVGSAAEYCMQVHLFDATSSPACAIYALHQTAEDNAHLFFGEVVQCVKNNFFKNDQLKSVYSNSQAIALYRNLTELLKRGGFRLAKRISNSENVSKHIPENYVRKSVLNVPDSNNSSYQRVLGIQ